MFNKRSPLSLLLLTLALTSSAGAQEAYRKSWTIQDRAHQLTQKIAQDVIARANDWQTRDDANAPVARLDDRVRVTVTTELYPTSGVLRDRLSRLTLGTIVIDTSFEQFLDTATIGSLVRRDHYWRDESVEVLNAAFADLQPTFDPFTVDDAREYDQAFAALDRRPRLRFALDESTISIGNGIVPWFGIGFEEMGLPDFSYGRARAGVIYGQMKLWSDLPLPIGSVGNPVLARGLESSLGFGMSFDTEMLGGAITWSDPSQRVGTSATPGDTSYVLGRAALLFGKIPLGPLFQTGGFIRLKVGLGYQQIIPLIARGDGETIDGTADDIPKLMARGEYVMPGDDGEIRRTAALEVLGSSIIASYREQIDRRFGVRVSLATHGILGDRAPYLPAFSIMISPTFSIW